MKSSILIFAFLFTGLAQAADYNFSCDVVTVEDYLLEESLGETGAIDTDEDATNVSVIANAKQKKISIGHYIFDSSKDAVSVKETATEFVATAPSSTQEVFQVKIYKKSKLGVVLAKEIDEPKFKVLATIDCNDYRAVKKAIVSGQVQKKEILVKGLPSSPRAKIQAVDVPAEMGDGYYTLTSEKFYALSINGKVVGYKLVSSLDYTEGPSVTTETYFLANGVRFQGPKAP